MIKKMNKEFVAFFEEENNRREKAHTLREHKRRIFKSPFLWILAPFRGDYFSAFAYLTISLEDVQIVLRNIVG